jgi:predicted DNA-binding transcriptional regulator AlpA
MAATERPWSIQEVSVFLSVPVGTLYRWRRYHTGPPAARIGRYLRYDPADVYAWFKDRTAA